MEINCANNGLISSSLKQDHEVVVPLQAQGHLHQLLQFACLISSYDLSAYYVGLANYNHQSRVRANALNPSDIAKIHFHDLTSNQDFASDKIPTIWDGCMLLRESIASFLRDISSKARRVVIVHDVLMSYNVQDVSSFHNAESYIFNCISSFDMYCSHICAAAGLPVPLEAEQLKRLPSLERCYDDEIIHVGRLQSPYMGIKAGDIYNTSKVTEGTTYLELLAQLASAQHKKQWAIGPILPTKLGVCLV